MQASLDCVVCLLRQSLEASRFATSDERVHARVMESVLRLILAEGLTCDAPRVGTKIHRLAREISGNPDPYSEQKRQSNERALERLDAFRRAISESRDPLAAATRLAIAGNSIDYAIAGLSREQVESAVSRALEHPLNGSIDDFRGALSSSRTVLYLTDNAGEIAYDRLLVELLLTEPYSLEVVVATRGKPVMNDATPEDAEFVGMTRLTRVIPNGGDGLGTIFELTSREFQELFTTSDLVVAQGMANYETLQDFDEIRPKKIAYLFKSKCEHMARFSGAPVGDFVVRVR